MATSLAIVVSTLWITLMLAGIKSSLDRIARAIEDKK